MSGLINKLSVSLKKVAVSRRGAAFLGVVGLGLGTLSYGVYRSSKFFSRLTHWDSAKIGIYLGGVGTAIGVGLTGRVYRLFTLPSAERVVSEVMVLLRANPEVKVHVGTTLRTGQFKAYAYGGGAKLQTPVTRDRWIPRWPLVMRPKNLQVMFQVLGDKSTGMVSLQVDRRPLYGGKGRRDQYSSLAVDFRNGERLIISGNPADIIFQGYTRLR
ncbi:hypothetical protein LOD99_15823 [Oopsacas minuta]|uniref:Uncharacterized protein n=1 Tax=Oopsacas minuta TaxID=111878 RepID=A0AAV7KB59_9METZ|nr:hypothetical protein LOD99_15823 [Oopsacas minuta]